MERYFAASRADDWAAFYEVVDSGFRAGRTPEQFSAWMRGSTPDFVRALTERTTHKLMEVQVDGDRATVQVQLEMPDVQAIPGERNRFPSVEEVGAVPLRSVELTFQLVREEGEWRVQLNPPREPAPEVLDKLRRAVDSLPPH